jgi:CO/xanthine dehydrogenase FAD-binding subunit
MSATRRKRISMDEFFTGMFSSALASDEVLVDVGVPWRAPRIECSVESRSSGQRNGPAPATRYEAVR